MGISEKQIKLVQSILYQGNNDNLMVVAEYIQELIDFRKVLTEKSIGI